MKSARELFEELGYTYQESYFEEKIDKYENQSVQEFLMSLGEFYVKN